MPDFRAKSGPEGRGVLSAVSAGIGHAEDSVGCAQESAVIVIAEVTKCFAYFSE
jgi:hypothetical protein